MKTNFRVLVWLNVYLVGGLFLHAGTRLVSHEIRITFEPSARIVQGLDRITLGQVQPGPFHFRLNPGLKAQAVFCHGVEVPVTVSAQNAPPSEPAPPVDPYAPITYEITLPTAAAGTSVLEVQYSGDLAIRYLRDYLAGLAPPPGTTAPPRAAVITLPPECYWYPRSDDAPSVITATVIAPADYFCIGPGATTGDTVAAAQRQVTWQEAHPLPPWGLIIGPFAVEKTSVSGIELITCVSPDVPPAAAGIYRQEAEKLLRHCVAMIGAYPFSKLAVVNSPIPIHIPSCYIFSPNQVAGIPENRAMLRNWFGDCVQADASGGTWADALVDYLASHLLDGVTPAEATAYRRNVLYSLSAGKDQSLKTLAQPGVTEVDRGKGMMVFHMLRNYISAPVFADSVKALFKAQAWKPTSWADLRRVFEAVHQDKLNKQAKDAAAKNIRSYKAEKSKDPSLEWFFKQWLDSQGLPILEAQVRNVFNPSEKQFMVSLVLKQSSPALQFSIPVVIETEAGKEKRWVSLGTPSREIQIMLTSDPRILRIDPDVEVLRSLYPAEYPSPSKPNAENTAAETKNPLEIHLD